MTCSGSSACCWWCLRITPTSWTLVCVQEQGQNAPAGFLLGKTHLEKALWELPEHAQGTHGCLSWWDQAALVQKECPEGHVPWPCSAHSQLFRWTHLLLLVCVTSAGTATVAVQLVPELSACAHTCAGPCHPHARACTCVCTCNLSFFCVWHTKNNVWAPSAALYKEINQENCLQSWEHFIHILLIMLYAQVVLKISVYYACKAPSRH